MYPLASAGTKGSCRGTAPVNRRHRREMEERQVKVIEERIAFLESQLGELTRTRRAVESLVLGLWEAVGRTAPSHEDQPAFLWWCQDLDDSVDVLVPGLYSDIHVLEYMLDKDLVDLELLLRNPQHSTKRALG